MWERPFGDLTDGMPPTEEPGPLTADDLIAAIWHLSRTLPTRCPTILRVGPGVAQELNGGKPIARPLIEPAIPSGVDLIEDAAYPPGRWRLFDQMGDELSSGVIPVPGATIRIDLEDGTSKTMQVVTVARDDAGRITEYTVVDPAVLEISSVSTRWFYGGTW